MQAVDGEREIEMKEIVLSCVLIVVIGVVAAFGLDAMNWSAEAKFTSEQGNVRIR